MLDCSPRWNTAPARLDSWQEEWNATYAELIGVLAAIEEGLAELAQQPTLPHLMIHTIDDSAAGD